MSNRRRSDIVMVSVPKIMVYRIITSAPKSHNSSDQRLCPPFHCMTAEASEGRNVELQHNLNDDFYGEPIELTGGKNWWRWACKHVDH